MSQRPLSLQERFSVVRRNMGFAVPVTFVVTYTSPEAVPTEAFLRERVEKLLMKYPLLNAEIQGTDTTQPYFTPRDQSWTPEDIINPSKDLAELGLEVDQSTSNAGVFSDGAGGEAVLKYELLRMEKSSLEYPLWQISLYSSSPTTTTYLALSVYHELADGLGSSRLLYALLCPDAEFCALPSDPLVTPNGAGGPEYKPGLRTLLPIVWAKMLVPKLPIWLQGYANSIVDNRIVWPGPDTQRSKALLASSWDLKTLSISADDVFALKVMGKQHGVQTLHPILKLALLDSLAAEVITPSNSDSYVLKGMSPRSERDSSLGHPYLSSNYFSCGAWTYDPKTNPSGATAAILEPGEPERVAEFWRTAVEIATHLASPSTISAGRQNIGLLSYLPDTPQGWEEHFTSAIKDGTHAPGESLELSNLGRMEVTGMPGSSDVIWGQAANPLSATLCVQAIGHDRGLRMCFGWREGCPLKAEQVERIIGSVKALVRDLIQEGARPNE